MTRQLIVSITKPMGTLVMKIREKIDQINSQQIVFFTHGEDISQLNHAMLYVRANEHSNRIKIVLVANSDTQVPERLAEEIELLDKADPEIDLEFVVRAGEFGPELIRELIRELREEWLIPANLMFIGSPTGHLEHTLSDLSGVRLII